MKLVTFVLCFALIVRTHADEVTQGYEELLAAAKLIIPGENGRPRDGDTGLASTENMRFERLAVARNTPALLKVRQALRSKINLPSDWEELSLKNKTRLSFYSPETGFRDLALQLRQQSDVCVADGDLEGALDARFTLLELAKIFLSDTTSRAPLVGAKMRALALQNFETLGLKLDVNQCRVAVSQLRSARLERPEYWSYLGSLQNQSKVALPKRDFHNCKVDIAQQRLIEGALELRAIKLETGLYPVKFQAPNDPFAPTAQLIYRRKDSGYLLCSVGPDAIDNGGAGIRYVNIIRGMKMKGWEGQSFDLHNETNWLLPESTGDISAPKF